MSTPAGRRYSQHVLVSQDAVDHAAFDLMAAAARRCAEQVVEAIHADGHEVAGDVRLTVHTAPSSMIGEPAYSRWQRLLFRVHLRKRPLWRPPVMVLAEARSQARRPVPKQRG